MGNTCIMAKFHRTDLVICCHSREGKTLPYSRINRVAHQNVNVLGSKLETKTAWRNKSQPQTLIPHFHSQVVRP